MCTAVHDVVHTPCTTPSLYGVGEGGAGYEEPGTGSLTLVTVLVHASAMTKSVRETSEAHRAEELTAVRGWLAGATQEAGTDAELTVSQWHTRFTEAVPAHRLMTVHRFSRCLAELDVRRYHSARGTVVAGLGPVAVVLLAVAALILGGAAPAQARNRPPVPSCKTWTCISPVERQAPPARPYRPCKTWVCASPIETGPAPVRFR